MDRETEALGQILRELRRAGGLTQVEVAGRLGQPQSLVSKLESGERSVRVAELDALAHAYGVNSTTILNRLNSFDSVLDRWGLSESELTELIDTNPSLRGMVFGYAAEVKFRRMYLAHRQDIISEKDDDHDRKRKGDRRLRVLNQDVVVEVKSLQTNKCVYDQTDGRWHGPSQVDGSDRRLVTFLDGSQLETTLLLRGEFDILAVNCFAFGGAWQFQFALNADLATSKYIKYTQEQRNQLLASLQWCAWPPVAPFTKDFDDVLARALAARTAGPQVMAIED